MFYYGTMKIEKLKKCNVSNAGIAHIIFTRFVLLGVQQMLNYELIGMSDGNFSFRVG